MQALPTSWTEWAKFVSFVVPCSFPKANGAEICWWCTVMRIMFLLSQLELKSRSFYPFRLLLFISAFPRQASISSLVTPAFRTTGTGQPCLVASSTQLQYLCISRCLLLFETLQLLDDCISFVSGFRIYFGASSPDV